MLSTPRAIFFDFDGVLVESAEIKTEAFVELFKDHPSLLPAIREYHLKNMGVSRFKKFEWIYTTLLNRAITQHELTLLGDDFSKIVYEKVIRAPFVPGAIALLEHVHKNTLCFVASGTPEEELKQIVEERKLTHYFKEVCGTPRTKTEIVEEMMVKYKFGPEQGWFIGDATTDLEAARATGLNFIARNTEVMEDYWKQRKNTWVVNSLEEVKDKWVHV